MQFSKLINVLIVNVLLSRGIPMEDLKVNDAPDQIDRFSSSILNEEVIDRNVRLYDWYRDNTCHLSCDRLIVYSRYTLSYIQYLVAH